MAMKVIGTLGDIVISRYSNNGSENIIFISNVKNNDNFMTTKQSNIRELIELLAEAADLDIVISHNTKENF